MTNDPKTREAIAWAAYEAATVRRDALWDCYSQAQLVAEECERAWRKAQRENCLCGGTGRLADHECPQPDCIAKHAERTP